MKRIATVFLLAAMGCNHHPKTVTKEVITKVVTNEPAKTDTTDPNAQYFTQADTAIIWNDAGDTLKYAQAEFNNIIHRHPEFFEDFPQSPEVQYAAHGTDPEGEFSSEVGNDVYCMFYTFYLRKLHTQQQYPDIRKKLNNIFANINKVLETVNRGGTYYGHMESRVPAFAEFWLKNYIDDNEANNRKGYDFAFQKSLFIQLFRQEMTDETNASTFIPAAERKKQIADLNQIISAIEQDLSSRFYLQAAERFRYGQY